MDLISVGMAANRALVYLAPKPVMALAVLSTATQFAAHGPRAHAVHPLDTAARMTITVAKPAYPVPVITPRIVLDPLAMST